MSPMVVWFPLDFARPILEKHGIYLLETFEDGQIRWGDHPPSSPYKGYSLITHPYKARLDIFTIRAIISKFGKSPEESRTIQSELEEFFNLDDPYPAGA